MKRKILISFFSVLFSLVSFCQTERPITKGHFFVGGAICFNSRTDETRVNDLSFKNKLTSFELSPNLSYFIINKLSIGFQLNSILTNVKYLSSGTREKSGKLLLAPSIRYYVYSGFFGEAAIGYGKVIYDEEKSNVIRGKVSLGYSYFINKNVALEPILSLSRYKENLKNTNNYNLESNEFNFALSLQAFF